LRQEMSAGAAKKARGRFDNAAHRSLRWRVSVATLLVAVGCATGSARGVPGADPWLTYVDAAVEARNADDPLVAEALLKAAYELAKQSDPQGARPALTRLLLTGTYAALDQMDKARSVAGEGLRLDVSQLDESLLPLADSLAKLGELAFARWKTFSQEKAWDQAARSRWEAENVSMLEAAIRQRAAPGTTLTARAVQFYARVLLYKGETEQSLQKFAAGVEIYQGIEQNSRALARGGQLLTLFPRKDAGADAADSGLMYNVDWDRAMAYVTRGEGLLEKKKIEEANNKPTNTEAIFAEAKNNFDNAEAIFKSLISQIEQYWPNNKALGNLYDWLGSLYDSDHLNLLVEAEAAYRHSLSVFLANEGPEGERVRSSARSLAAVLREEGKADEAAAIETSYKVTSASAKE
jgi:hypothetical protein